jgi:hypothetical protein
MMPSYGQEFVSNGTPLKAYVLKPGAPIWQSHPWHGEASDFHGPHYITAMPLRHAPAPWSIDLDLDTRHDILYMVTRERTVHLSTPGDARRKSSQRNS